MNEKDRSKKSDLCLWIGEQIKSFYYFHSADQ